MPDLEDPATLGCLLALVREAAGDRFIAPRYLEVVRVWQVAIPMPGHLWNWTRHEAPTEAEALIIALESAAVEAARQHYRGNR